MYYTLLRESNWSMRHFWQIQIRLISIKQLDTEHFIIPKHLLNRIVMAVFFLQLYFMKKQNSLISNTRKLYIYIPSNFSVTSKTNFSAQLSFYRSSESSQKRCALYRYTLSLSVSRETVKVIIYVSSQYGDVKCT